LPAFIFNELRCKESLVFELLHIQCLNFTVLADADGVNYSAQMFRALAALLIFFSAHYSFADESDLHWDKNQSVAIHESAGVKMLWWNIHWGSLKVGGSNIAFQNNLATLVHSRFAPDVMAFAEYSPLAMGPALLNEFQNTYPYHQDFAYPTRSDEGIAVFSKFPFSVSSVDPIGSRDLILLNLNVNGKEIVFAPTHIEDAWRDFHKENGTAETLEQILVGTKNPVWGQVVAFRSALESRLGARLSEKNFIMMGDFNSMKPSRAYDKMSWDLHDPVLGFAGTFPASGSADQKEFPVQIQIDHAFVSSGTEVESAQILPLSGSDHYALYVTVNP
jgi:endonuclease/exonuclease/phosphatase family metal-dependent hydrolase